MGFNTEEEMKDVAKNTINRDFAREDSILIDEFSYGNGRADLVLANPSAAYLEHRINDLEISSTLENKIQLQVFLQLHGRGEVTRQHFYSIGAINKCTKKDVINTLIQKGFIKETPSGKIHTARDLRRHVTTSYSIELKIGKWKKALEQAKRGKAFSQYQYVALPEENILRAINNISRFEENEVGLMELSEDGNIFVHYKPAREDPFSPLNKWRLNERTVMDETSNPICSD